MLAAGCGGQQEKPDVTIRGTGFEFIAPGGWEVTRTASSVEAVEGRRILSVTVFKLARPYRSALWPKVMIELDSVAAGLADQLRGQVGPGKTLTVASARARRYDISFESGGAQLVERITFVLEGRREYQLLCRYAAGGDAGACAALGSSFRLR